MTRYLFLKILGDIILIPLIVIAAYSLKFKLGLFFSAYNIPFGQIYHSAQIEPYLDAMWLITLLWIFTFYFSGVYHRYTGLMPWVDEGIALFKGVSIASIALMALTFILRPFPESRFVLVYCWVLGLVVLMSYRFVLSRFENYFLHRGQGLKPALIVGAENLGQSVTESILLSPSLGYRYMGSIDQHYPEYCHFHLRDKLFLIGDPSTLLTQVLEKKPAALFITIPLTPSQIDPLIQLCRTRRIDLYLHTQVFTISIDPLTGIQEFDGIPFLKLYTPPTWTAPLLLKRWFDIVMSLTALILLSPLLLIIAIVIKWSSPEGPIIYTQERVGKNNQSFLMYKFRTMIPDAESHSGPVMVNEKKDSRYIKFGDFFRKTSMDELPQLWNIIKGEMSIVGPRPERPFFVEQFSQTIPHFGLRHQVQVGLTGWAQINGRSVLTSNPEHKLRYDLHYIRHWSLAFDLKILIKTIFVVFSREEAY